MEVLHFSQFFTPSWFLLVCKPSFEAVFFITGGQGADDTLDSFDKKR